MSQAFHSPDPIKAAEWSAEPRLRVKGEFNDNILLTTQPHDSVYGVWTSPELTIKGATESLSVQGHIRLDFAEYLNKENLDITQQFYTGSLNYRTETVELGLTGNFSRDSVLRGEFEETGVIGDIGLVERRRIRKRHQVNPVWTVNLTERSSVQFNYQYADVDFRVPPGTGLVGYQVHSASSVLSQQIFEQSQVQVATQFLYFDAPSANTKTESYGGQLGFTTNLTEMFVASVSSGLQFVSTDASLGGINQDSDRVVWTIEGNLEQRFEKGSIRGQGSRAVNPSGTGLLVKTDRFNISLTSKLTSRLTASLTGGFVFSESLTERTVSVPEARSYSVQPSFRWQWNEDLVLGLSYRHRRIERETTGGTSSANSNAVFVTLRYQLPRLATSE